MRYAFFPFPSLKNAGGADICDRLRSRKSQMAPRSDGIENLELLEEMNGLLRDLPWKIHVDHCDEADGDLRLAVIAIDLGRNIATGDRVNAGFCLANSEQRRFDTVACERIYRVVCANGALVECEEGQTMVISASAGSRAWKARLREVIARSFDADGLDLDAARFHATTTQMITTPYELLCNLVAQNTIDEDEQIEIQREFNEAADFTMYGLINAFTTVARQLRESDDWLRAFAMERLGGELLRGDHQPPVFDLVYR